MATHVRNASGGQRGGHRHGATAARSQEAARDADLYTRGGARFGRHASQIASQVKAFPELVKPFAKLLSRYLDDLQLRNYSPRTVSDYGYSLRALAVLLAHRAIAPSSMWRPSAAQSWATSSAGCIISPRGRECRATSATRTLCYPLSGPFPFGRCLLKPVEFRLSRSVIFDFTLSVPSC